MNETTKENINRCLVKIKKDDPYAVEELHGIVSSSLRHIALKYLHNEQDADDLIQDFWADIFNIARNFYFVNNGFAFLCKVMTSKAINKYKRLNREKMNIVHIEYVDYRHVKCAHSEDNQHMVDNRILVEKAMESLSNMEKIVIQSVYFEDKTIRQIAKEINLPRSTAGDIKNRAISKLKKALEEEL